MATYKKGYKKQNPQMAVLKTIVAIIAVVLILILAVFIYDKTTDWKDYSSYDHLETYDQVLSQDKDDYVVYFYSETCPACQDIKDNVMDTLNDQDKEYGRVFLVDVDNFDQAVVPTDEQAFTKENLLAALGIEDITTPLVVVVANGEFEEAITGKVNINDFMDKLDNDSYIPFNE